MPRDAAGGTVGCAFIEYQTASDAKQAAEVLEGYRFDKNHALRVTPHGRATALGAMEDGAPFSLPEPEPFKERPNTMSWLEDGSQRDQFAVREGKETRVMWSDGKGEPLVDYDGAREKKAGVHRCE